MNTRPFNHQTTQLHKEEKGYQGRRQKRGVGVGGGSMALVQGEGVLCGEGKREEKQGMIIVKKYVLSCSEKYNKYSFIRIYIIRYIELDTRLWYTKKIYLYRKCHQEAWKINMYFFHCFFLPSQFGH